MKLMKVEETVKYLIKYIAYNYIILARQQLYYINVLTHAGEKNQPASVGNVVSCIR